MNSDEPEKATSEAHDAKAPMSDWKMLDDIIENFPKASYPGLLPHIPEEDGRYRVGHWWFTLFERHWQLRGMTNALMDYYTDPDQVHRLFSALTDFYIGVIDRMKDAGADAIYSTDDLGTQDGPFFSLDIFNKFYAPYYEKLIDAAHDRGMHYWLHTCGDVALYMPRFIELGLDVIHPIQKFAMSAADTARDFGGKICFWAGFDVQEAIPRGTPKDVRAEVHKIFDTFHRPDGRLMITLGNGATEDTPPDSLEALFDEAFLYGEEIVTR